MIWNAGRCRWAETGPRASSRRSGAPQSGHRSHPRPAAAPLLLLQHGCHSERAQNTHRAGPPRFQIHSTGRRRPVQEHLGLVQRRASPTPASARPGTGRAGVRAHHPKARCEQRHSNPGHKRIGVASPIHLRVIWWWRPARAGPSLSMAGRFVMDQRPSGCGPSPAATAVSGPGARALSPAMPVPQLAQAEDFGRRRLPRASSGSAAANLPPCRSGPHLRRSGLEGTLTRSSAARENRHSTLRYSSANAPSLTRLQSYISSSSTTLVVPPAHGASLSTEYGTCRLIASTVHELHA